MPTRSAAHRNSPVERGRPDWRAPVTAAAFLVDFFGFTQTSNQTSAAMAFLSDNHGFTLVLQKKRSSSESYPEGFHLGFFVDDVQQVHDFHARATAAGLHASAVETNARGTQTYCRTADGLLIEVSKRAL